MLAQPIITAAESQEKLGCAWNYRAAVLLSTDSHA